MSKKPDKYGLKFWLCVDTDSHYVFNAFPYVGRQPNVQRQTQIDAKVVLELLEPLYGSSRNVTMDNFFTSVPLAQELQTKNLTLVGTMQRNKLEIPIEFQSNKDREVNSLLFGFQDDLTLVFLSLSRIERYCYSLRNITTIKWTRKLENQLLFWIIIKQKELSTLLTKCVINKQ